MNYIYMYQQVPIFYLFKIYFRTKIASIQFYSFLQELKKAKSRMDYIY